MQRQAHWHETSLLINELISLIRKNRRYIVEISHVWGIDLNGFSVPFCTNVHANYVFLSSVGILDHKMSALTAHSCRLFSFIIFFFKLEVRMQM